MALQDWANNGPTSNRLKRSTVVGDPQRSGYALKWPHPTLDSQLSLGAVIPRYLRFRENGNSDEY